MHEAVLQFFTRGQKIPCLSNGSVGLPRLQKPLAVAYPTLQGLIIDLS